MFTTARLQLNHDRLPRTDYRIPEIKRTVFVLPVRAVSRFDGLIFTIGDGPSAIVTAASAPRSLPSLSERRIVEWQGHLVVVSMRVAQVMVVAVHLSEVMVLEVVIERFEELVEGDHGFIG